MTLHNKFLNLKDSKSKIFISNFNKKINIIFLCFNLNGKRKDEYIMCLYAILSFFKKHNQIDPKMYDIYVYTDDAEKFEYVKDRVKIRLLSHSKLKKWARIGKEPFMLFIKMMVILEVTKKTKNNILFLDSDVIIKKEFSNLVNKLSKRDSFMFEKEYKLKDKKNIAGFVRHVNKKLQEGNKDAKKVELIIGKSINSFLSGTFPMWNSGLLAIHKSNINILEPALDLTKALLSLRKNIPKYYKTHAIEQLAYTFVLLSNSKLHPAKKYINHYWRSKKLYVKRIKIFINIIKKKNITIEDLIHTKKYNYLFFSVIWKHMLLRKYKKIRLFTGVCKRPFIKI